MAAKNDINLRAGLSGKETIKNDLGEIVGYVENYTNKLKNADFSTFNRLADKLNRADFGSGAVSNMQKLGQQTALTRQQALSLTYTFNDVTASLASGISPMTILLQQGGQLSQAFGGLRGTVAAIGPMLLKWSVPLAGLAAVAGAVYMVMKVDEKGNAAAKKINDIGDAAKKAKVSGDELQALMQALVKGGDAPAEGVANVAANAINKLRDTVAEASKAQKEIADKYSASVFQSGQTLEEKQKAIREKYAPKKQLTPQQEMQKELAKATEDYYAEIAKAQKDAGGMNAPLGMFLPGAGAPTTSVKTDIFSRLGVKIPESVSSLKELLAVLLDIQKAYKALPEGQSKFEIGRMIDKQYPEFARMIQRGSQAELRGALSGNPDRRYAIPEDRLAEADRVERQQQDIAYKTEMTGLKKDSAYMGVAEAGNRAALADLDAEAGKITLLDQAWKKAADAKLGYYAIRPDIQEAVSKAPAAIGSVVAGGFGLETATKEAGAAVGNFAFEAAKSAGVLKTATDQTAAALQPSIIQQAIAAIGQLAFEAANAAGALRQTAASSASGPGATGRASGGYITGPGTSTSDSIPAMLSHGEYVVRAAAVRNFGLNFMHAINAGIRPPGFADGGLAAAGVAGMASFAGGGAGRGLTLVLDGKSFGGFSGSADVVGALEKHALMRRISSASKRASSRIG